MATYNGGRHIHEQLKSIANQLHAPDELVICDDGSTDNTLELIENFASTAPFSIALIRNAQRLGYAANFIQTIKLCRNEIIFISDQDDVWLNTKILTLVKCFQSAATPFVVIADQIITDDNLVKSKETTLSTLRKFGRNKNEFVHGCCTAISKSIVPLVALRPEFSAHDDWIHLIGRMSGHRVVIGKPLQLYRRHIAATTSSNLNSFRPIRGRRFIGPRNSTATESVLSNLDKRIKPIKHLLAVLSSGAQLEYTGTNYTPKLRANATAELSAIQNRIENLRHRSLVKILSAYVLGEYRFFNGFKTAARDAFSVWR